MLSDDCRETETAQRIARESQDEEVVSAGCGRSPAETEESAAIAGACFVGLVLCIAAALVCA